MNTRTSNNSDPGHAPERNLSSVRNRPITISLAIAAQACRTYPKEAREACLWLANLAANSQRIQLCWQNRFLPDPLGTVGRIAEADLCEKLGLHRTEVYAALTGHEEADLAKFCLAVKRLRKQFEESLPPLITTEDSKAIEQSFEIASNRHQIVTVEGKWRHGKTAEAERVWLTNLHRCVWLHCPEDNTERSFLNEFAAVLGVGIGFSKKPFMLRQQVKRALGIGLIDTVIIDEGHRLWTGDPANSDPKRIEFVRNIKDTLGVGFVVLWTEQGALNLEIAKQQNTRYAPGQFAGRRYQFKLRDAHSDSEIHDILLLHSGNVTKDALKRLMEFTKTEEGYLGAGIEAVINARLLAGNGASFISREHADSAIKQQRTDERVKALATAAKPARRGRVKLLAA